MRNFFKRFAICNVAWLTLLTGASATIISWDTTSGTWDTSDTTHWTPTQVPVNNDIVNITAASAGLVEVDYAASANFSGTDNLEKLYISNSGSGTNRLIMGAGDTLRIDDGASVNTALLSVGARGQIIVGGGASLTQAKTGTGADRFAIAGGEIEVDGGTLYNASITRVKIGALRALAGSHTANAGIEVGKGSGWTASVLLDNSGAGLAFSGGFGATTVGYTSGTGTGTLDIKNASSWDFNDMTINLTGILRGYGSVSGGSGDDWLFNGTIIADGYGVAQDLDLTGVSGSWNSTVENTTDKGWYAVNKGRLRMEDFILISSGGSNNPKSWGESASDADIDRVNSVRFVPSGFPTVNNTYLYGYLYDPTRGDVPTLPQAVDECLSIHRFQFNSGRYYSSCGITIRYDEPEHNHGEYRVYWRAEAASNWTKMTITSQDVDKKQISFSLPDSGGTVTGLGWFAVFFHGYGGTVITVK